MIRDAVTWLHAQRPAMESLLRAMVEVSSHTRDKAGVDAAGALLRGAIPIACEPVASARFGDHLFFHNGRRGESAGVVLVGHHDTVFPASAFSGWRVEGDAAVGPGALDMKGGLVVIAFALQALARAGLLASIPLSVAVLADEEAGSPESGPYLREVALGATAALVFESGRAGDAIVTRRKGTGSIVVTAHGKAAHAGNGHHEGANAVWALARWIDRAQNLTDLDRGVTVNVGRVEGGIGRNTVPDLARAEVDFRFVTVHDGAAVVAAMHALALECAVPGTTITVEGGVARNPLVRTPESAALRDRYAACQREAGLGDGEMDLVGGGSDASTTSDAGVPSIDGLGPRGSGFHTVKERVELATLVPKAEALVRFLAGFAAVPG